MSGNGSNTSITSSSTTSVTPSVVVSSTTNTGGGGNTTSNTLTPTGTSTTATTNISGSGSSSSGGGGTSINSSSHIGSSSSTDYTKTHVETLTKELKQLKTKLDNYERENKDLKKSIYDLTARYDMLVYQTGKSHKPFNIDAIFTSQTPEVSSSGSIDQSTTPVIVPPPTLVSDVNEERVSSTQQRTSKKMDERHFFYKFTLKGHNASVYSVKFSPCGKMLASASFDKTLKIWDVFNQREISTLSEHNVNVSEVAWNNDSTEILSGSYDKTVKLWDLQQPSKSIASFNTSGFVLDVMFSPVDNNIFFAGNTQNHIIGFDKRTPNSIFVLENDSFINSLHIFKDGQHILTGDSNGKLKVWDTRKSNKITLPEGFHSDIGVDGMAGSKESCPPIDTFDTSQEGRPISGITMSSTNSEGDDGRFLAVNSYDNVLRVYDRSKVSIVSHPYSLAPMKLLHSLTSHKNKNWPIKSSIFVGKDFNDGGNIKRSGEQTKSEEDDDDENKCDDINQSVLLATGSADYNAYLFDIGFTKQSGKVLQKLEGHTDRVYSVKFHPSEPILASCSADSTIRLWTPKKKIFNQ
ncbi:hypothetical protein PPL_11940 [Heterostelium album PN500]|uniref:WD40 repeat-containing protein n=1 Tax=Heterostelium pallidum (strain ATCC 26659 / Pp 5 / PN500) TaxID=670386 RepID=D3BUW8_HETP5|nr:hypothetical protein PPL_11940 [Heterostelium album PN500]EFA74906.1 hypothetical protein PPL_11940 [Heterostelium album PN500]|eukprot:XP_020427040.1 hypothetical protein PPL_11940 [Heterostelium album PN500]